MNNKYAELNIEFRVIKVLSDYFPVGRRKIESGSRLVEDLYVDSMSLVEIVMALNEYFDIVVPTQEVAGWRLVADVCGSVRLCVDCEK